MERLTRNERVLLIVAAVLAVFAGTFAWRNFTRAFPEANLVFSVNRSSSQPVAEAFVRKHAERAAPVLAGRRHAAIFRYDNDAKVYLERELGLDKLGEMIAAKQVRLWSWSHRYFKPLEKEELRVQVSPEGEVTGFNHLIAEEAPGASLDEPAARAAADSLLQGAFGVAPQQLTFIESKREDRKQRRDWTFTYERSGWQAKDATYRMQVEVHGDEAAAYREFLKIPDAWSQSYQRLRSANDTTALVAAFGIVLTIFAAVWTIIREGRRGNLRWRVILTFTALAFVLVFLLSLNDLPMSMYGFSTTDSWGAFLAKQVLGGLAGAGGQALLILIVVAAGEPLYRQRFPGHLRVGALLTRSGWGSKRTVIGLALGYCLAALFIAYQVGFYLFTARFGAWNPAEIPFDNLLNTSFPWLAVLFMGFYPAVSEEFMSRVFSIPLVERLTRSRVAAVIIPAMIWGFAHANYPAQPFYIRGVEVALAGLAVGIVLYRFGVLPCLVWHYVVDAGYTSMLLVRSGNPYFVITAIVGTGVLLVPLVVAVIAAWRRGGFAVDENVVNAADPAPPEPAAVVAEPAAALTVPPVRRAMAIALVVAVVGGVLAWKAPDAGEGIGVRLRPADVRAIAEAYLRERGVDPAAWRLVVTAREDYLGRATRRYLLEHGGVPQVARFAQEVPAWQVRAFRPESREEWQLGVDDRDRKVVRYGHALPEEAPGASLAVEEARPKAEAALGAAGFNVSELVFKEATSEKRPARLDHEFTWKDPGRSVGDAEYLVSVTVAGDGVAGESRRFKLPEEWERARDRGTVIRYGLIALKIAVIAWLVVHGLFVFYRAVRTGSIPWKPIAVIAAAFAVIAAIGSWLTFPLVWASYDVAWPEVTFRTSMLIGMSIAVLFQAAGAVLALGMLAACFPAARAVMVPALRRTGVAAGAWAAVAVVGASLALSGAVGLARFSAPGLFPDAPVGVPDAVATAVPGLAAFLGRLLPQLMLLALVGLAVNLWATARRGFERPLLLAGIVIVLVPGGAEASPGEFLAGLASAVAALVLGFLLIRCVLGANPVAWVLAALALAAKQAVLPLLGQPGAAYTAQGWALLGVVIVVTALWLGRRGSGAGAVESRP